VKAKGRCVSLALSASASSRSRSSLSESVPGVVGQRDHLSQYRPCRPALLDRRGEAVKVGLRVDGGDRPVRAPGEID
jgi:hypothetical protein